MTMQGTLGDIFELRGRGIIACLERYTGSVVTGDWLCVGERRWEIVGVELSSDKQKRERAEQGLPPTIGVLLRDASKEEMLALSGQRFETSSG